MPQYSRLSNSQVYPPLNRIVLLNFSYHQHVSSFTFEGAFCRHLVALCALQISLHLQVFAGQLWRCLKALHC